MSVSLCIATYNALALTRDCFNSLVASLPDIKKQGIEVKEIIIVDDFSTDGTREYLKTLGAPFRVFFNAENCGYAYSNNFAAQNATGEFLCFLNADTLLTPNWLPPMLKAMQKDSEEDSAKDQEIGFIGNIQRNAKTRRIDHAGIYFDAEGSFKHFGHGWRWAPAEEYHQWPAVTAACCLVKKETFLRFGGFDESYRNGFEDIDLCLRMSEKGLKHWVAGKSIIDHHISSSPGRKNNEEANRALFSSRWKETLQKSYTPSHTKIDAVNYLLRFWDQPWRYNGKKLKQAFVNALGI